jgi:hypothetical protein
MRNGSWFDLATLELINNNEIIKTRFVLLSSAFQGYSSQSFQFELVFVKRSTVCSIT